jgi:hypothetical protein
VLARRYTVWLVTMLLLLLLLYWPACWCAFV